MNQFSIRVFDHNWGRVLLPNGIEFAPQSWEAEAMGGPSDAEIAAYGDPERLSELINWVGYTVWIMSPDEEYLWWGDIEEVMISHAGDTIGSSLKEVANRIKVLYTDDSPGGEMEAAETDWATDADSVTLYGYRERQQTGMREMRAAQAEQLRDTLLEKVSRPIPVVGRLGASDRDTTAMLRCTGFWKRLGRVYYANNNGLTEYTTGSQLWPLGLGFTGHVAFVNRNDVNTLQSPYGRFKGFTAPDLRISVTGTASNNGLFTITASDDRDADSVTSDTIEFDPDNDIRDATLGGFGFVEANDVIVISGSASNDGAFLVKTPTATHLETSPGFGTLIVGEAAGADVTVFRGNKITVEQTVTNEDDATSATVVAHGQRIAQGFYTGSTGDWVLASVEIKLRKVGAPTDGVYVRLRADSGGSPTGSILDSSLVDDADISDDENGRWVEFEFTGGVTLDNSTLYWLEVLRSGADDSADYYEVMLDVDGGYGASGLLLYTGATYVSPLNPLSMLFRLKGAVDTATQVGEICESMDVFAEVRVLDLSGLETNQYRDGSLYAAEEVKELLDTGDVNDAPMQVLVSQQRWVDVRAQPDPAEARYIWRQGELLTLQKTPVRPGMLPVGEWCLLDNPVLLQGALASASPFLIEYASYTVDRGWQLRAAGEPDPWALGDTLDG